MATKKTAGQPKAGGPRKQIRFASEKQIKEIQKAVDEINEGLELGNISFNSFVAGAAHQRAKSVLIENGVLLSGGKA